jgi:hypothetical protein
MSAAQYLRPAGVAAALKVVHIRRKIPGILRIFLPTALKKR